MTLESPYLSQNMLNNSRTVEVRAEILGLFVRSTIQIDGGLWRERQEDRSSEYIVDSSSFHSRAVLPSIKNNGPPAIAEDRGVMLVKNASPQLHLKHTILEISLEAIARNLFFHKLSRC